MPKLDSEVIRRMVITRSQGRSKQEVSIPSLEPSGGHRKRPKDENKNTQKKKRVKVKREKTHESTIEQRERASQAIASIINKDTWISGETDIRERAAKLTSIMAQLYRLRWKDNDRFKMIHWNKVSAFLREFPDPIRTSEEIEQLIHHRGIGASTVHVLLDIQASGYLDYIEDLYVQVEMIHQWDARRMQQLEAIGERVQQIQVNHEERRALLRTMAMQRFNETTVSESSSKVSGMMGKGTVVTGKQRREMMERPEEKGKQEKEENILTRSALRLRKTQESAIIAAEASDSCAICFEEYDDTSLLQVFDCRHCFHVECMQQWLLSRVKNAIDPTCPLCRRPIVHSQ